MLLSALLRFMSPSTTSMTATDISIDRPTRGGMTQPNSTMAPPTSRMVAL
jgi:hypothetical protein